MRLIKISIENFRSYKDKVSISLDNFTAFIGKNEHGKSTILEALEIFFNNETVKIDQNDACVRSTDKIVKISCEFDSLPQNLILDATSQTTLTEEHLINSSGNLEIVKAYDCSKTKISPDVFAYANHPTHAQAKDLLLLKQTDLKKRASEIGVDLAAIDVRSNKILREAIKSHISSLDFNEILIPLNKEDGKEIWEQIQKHLPTYALFQSDRTSNEDDEEVTDPMKLAVAEAIKTVAAELDAIKQKVKEHAMNVAERTINKLKEMDENIATNLVLDFKAEPKWDGFKLTLSDEQGIPLNKRGSGTRRLILLNFFRAEAERRREERHSPSVIFAVEEPENSQHPDYQKMLVRSLLTLSNQPNTQVFLTTHVPNLAQMLPQGCIKFVQKNSTGQPVIYDANDSVLEKIANALGVLSDSRVELLVFVEGPNDVMFLEHISKILHIADPSIPSLSDDPRIAVLPTGGGTLKHWVSKKYLKGFNRREVHIYDLDNENQPPYESVVNEINARGNGDWATLTGKRETENYLHSAAINLVYGINVIFGAQDDVPEIVAKAVYENAGNLWDQLSDNKKAKKVSRAKARLNDEAAGMMTASLLRQSDTNGDIEAWLRQIDSMLNVRSQAA